MPARRIHITCPAWSRQIFVNFEPTGVYNESGTHIGDIRYGEVPVEEGDIVFVGSMEWGLWRIRGDEEFVKFGWEETGFGKLISVRTKYKEVAKTIGMVSSNLIPRQSPPTQQDFDRAFANSGDVTILHLNHDKLKVRDISAALKTGSMLSLEIARGLTEKECELLSMNRHLVNLKLGSARASDLKHLAGLTSLLWLELESLAAEDISFVAGMERLRVIDLNEVKVSDWSALSNLRSLVALYIWHSNLDDLRSLAGLDGLEALELHGLPLTSLDGVERLTKLEALWLGEIEIDSLEPLAKLKNLFFLYLYDIPPLSLEPLAHLDKLTDIRIQVWDESHDQQWEKLAEEFSRRRPDVEIEFGPDFFPPSYEGWGYPPEE